jgi:hypothetical protein
MNLMNASESFQKALFLLDRGDIARGEQLLREVITSTESNREMLYYQACCCLGELLVESGRDGEAAPFLQQVAALDTTGLYDDLLDEEIHKARSLLKM